jgi:RHS repeat-associated protein
MANNVYADFSSTGSLETRYLAGPALDQVFGQVANGTTTWNLTDSQGSVRQVVGVTGNVLDTIDYDAYGNITSESNPSAASRFKYDGMAWDAALGLYLDHAREYDPADGVFISQDPLSFSAGQANISEYVGNSPTNGTDPTGLVDYLGLLKDFAGQEDAANVQSTFGNTDPRTMYMTAVSMYYSAAYGDPTYATSTNVTVWDPGSAGSTQVDFGSRYGGVKAVDAIPIPQPPLDVLFVSDNPSDKALSANYAAANPGAKVIPVSGADEIEAKLQDFINQNPEKAGSLRVGIGDHGAPGTQYLGGGKDKLTAAGSTFDRIAQAFKNAGVSYVYLMGCNVGSTASNSTTFPSGATLLQKLAVASGATVAANTTQVVPFPNGQSMALVNGWFNDRPALITVSPTPPTP